VTVPHLLLIDATLGAVAIMVATWIVVWRWWRDRLPYRHKEVAGLPSEETAPGEMTVVPGFNEGAADAGPAARGPDPGGPELDHDLQAADPGVPEPAGLEQPPPQVSGVADAGSGADDPEPGAHGPARPQQAPAQLNGAAVAGPGAHEPAAEPGGQPAADGTVTSRGRVSSYYKGADQQMADYLAELGWSEESESGARDWG
jgi:hypothetical protein